LIELIDCFKETQMNAVETSIKSMVLMMV